MADQSSEWEGFYEKAWGMRKQLADQFVKLGVTDPYQIIQKMNLVENRYTLARDNLTQKFSFKPKEYPGETRFYPTGKPLYNYVHLGEQIFAQPTYASPVDFLLDYLDGEKFDAIVEVGSGYGENLIELIYRGGPKAVPYYAAEFSQSGVDLTKHLIAMRSDLGITPFYFDAAKPDLSLVKEKKNILVFTSHVMQRMSDVTAEFFKCLADHAERVTCIHFEPFGFQIDDNEKGEASKLQEVVFKNKKWNLNFATQMFECHKSNIFRMAFVAKNVMGRELGNPTSVAIWQSTPEIRKLRASA
jgi:hypothetical protein